MKRLFASFVLVIAFLLMFAFVTKDAYALFQLQEYWIRAEDEQGNPVTSGVVRVYNADTLSLSTLYSDAQATAKSNTFSLNTTTGKANWYSSATSHDVVVDSGIQQAKENITLQKHRIIVPTQLENRVVVNYQLTDSDAALAHKWGEVFYIADKDLELVSFKARHETAAGGLGYFMLVKAASGTAISSGTNMLSASLVTNATADTNQSGVIDTLAANIGNIQLSEGDALGLIVSHSITSMSGFNCTVVFKKR